MPQVLDHQESTRLQYGLVQRAVTLGWPETRVMVIDEDLGRSGTSAEDRHGFQRLVAEVGLDHVGLILGVEMSRLACSSKDGHHLLEIWALFGTLIADLDGIDDPGHYNDRFWLGLKGTMREAELPISSNSGWIRAPGRRPAGVRSASRCPWAISTILPGRWAMILTSQSNTWYG
jgi:DNA invertase Pin-like site-specific DNA recombinase